MDHRLDPGKILIFKLGGGKLWLAGQIWPTAFVNKVLLKHLCQLIYICLWLLLDYGSELNSCDRVV